ncbi:MAG: polyhydroxyalkanoic acid system family protein [Pseudomonadota bacterium]|nr:polyhydroxyalkanoic acid system family protein [Pseudomonadota bacterium]
MSSINIVHPTTLEMAQARAAVDQVAARLTQEYGLACQWQDDELRFERPGVTGSIRLMPQQVHFSAELGFPFSAMQNMVEAGVRKALAEKLG